jgi:hypothetical protein
MRLVSEVGWLVVRQAGCGIDAPIVSGRTDRERAGSGVTEFRAKRPEDPVGDRGDLVREVARSLPGTRATEATEFEIASLLVFVEAVLLGGSPSLFLADLLLNQATTGNQNGSGVFQQVLVTDQQFLAFGEPLESPIRMPEGFRDMSCGPFGATGNVAPLGFAKLRIPTARLQQRQVGIENVKRVTNQQNHP